MIQKVHVTKVSWDDKDKNGNKLISQKSGKPYYKVGIKCEEFGDTFINGLLPFNAKDWEGQEKELEIFDEEYNGKTYKKFKLPPRAPMGGMSDNDRAQIVSANRDATAALQMGQEHKRMIGEILRRLELAGIKEYTSEGKPVPDFDDPPIEAYEENT